METALDQTKRELANARAMLDRAKNAVATFASYPPDEGPVRGFKTAHDGVVAWRAIVREWESKVAGYDAQSRD